MRRTAFGAIALLVAGCSLFVDLNGLSDSAGGADALVPEGSAMDGAQTNDGSSQEAPPFECPDASIVCDDFDDGPLGAKWTAVTIQNGTLAIDDAASFSPPNSLLVTLPDNPGRLTRYNRLEKSITGLSSIDCRFEVRLDATDSTSSSDVALLGLILSPAGYTNYQVIVDLQAQGLFLEQDTDTGKDGGSLSHYDNLTAFSSGVWTNVHITTDLGTIQVFVDDVRVYSQPILKPISQATGSIYFGQAHDSEPPAWTYRLDDVVCSGN
jgi:hypothetical protein